MSKNIYPQNNSVNVVEDNTVSSSEGDYIEQEDKRTETGGQIAGRYFYEIFVRGLLAGTCAGVAH